MLERIFAVEKSEKLWNAVDDEHGLGQKETRDGLVHRIERIIEDHASPDKKCRQNARNPDDTLMIFLYTFVVVIVSLVLL
jgi:hypothetical protein